MPNDRINIPTDRKGKEKLLEDLLTGRKTVNDLIEDTISIELNCTPSEADRAAFAANRARQDAWQGDANRTYLTIDL